ncbi:MAG: threonylcarbamoyl-AMP synthase [Muribaculaceae bacterium]|nr:threonylcarbamoyl-AMP synthase [Muribaculaceae bacterium]
MKNKGIPSYKSDLEACIEVLRRGGLILYPTDTIWGIGCDATNAAAVQRVYSLKKRDSGKPLIVLLDSVDHIDHYVVDVPPMALELIDVAVNPLTIIFEGAFNLAPALLGERDSVGVRVTADPFCRELCARLGRPLVSTSANVSGEPAPACFAQVGAAIKRGVDYVVNYRQDDVEAHTASNIILLRGDGTFKIIR